MTTMRKPHTQNESAAAKERAELRQALTETEDAFADLRKALGMPARRVVLIGGEQTLQRKRIEAGELMTKLGYRIDYRNEKSGLVRIVGPNFCEDFGDIADFDGTADNAVSNYR